MLFAVCSRFASSSVVLTRVGKAALLILALLCSEACSHYSTFTPQNANQEAYSQIVDASIIVYPTEFDYLIAAEAVIIGTQKTSASSKLSDEMQQEAGASDAAEYGATHIVQEKAWLELKSQEPTVVKTSCSRNICISTVTEGEKYYTANSSYLLLRVEPKNWGKLPINIRPSKGKELQASVRTDLGGDDGEAHEAILGGLGIILGEPLANFEGACARLKGSYSFHGQLAKCRQPQVQQLEFMIDEIEVESCDSSICLITASSSAEKATVSAANSKFEKMGIQLSGKYGDPIQSVAITANCATDLEACFSAGKYKRSQLWGQSGEGRLLLNTFESELGGEWHVNYTIVYLNDDGITRFNQRDL